MHVLYKCEFKSADDGNNYKFELSYSDGLFHGGQYMPFGTKFAKIDYLDEIAIEHYPFPTGSGLDEATHICIGVKDFGGHRMIVSKEAFSSLCLYLIRCHKCKDVDKVRTLTQYELFFNNVHRDVHSKVDVPRGFFDKYSHALIPAKLKLLIAALLDVVGEVDSSKHYLEDVGQSNDINDIYDKACDYVNFEESDIKQIRALFPEFKY